MWSGTRAMSETKKNKASRRLVLQASVGLAAAACAPSARGQAADLPAQACRESSVTDAGPFYPEGDIPRRWDLIAANATPAAQMLYVTGKVHDAACAALGGASATLWQADRNGRYNHRAAGNDGPLDPAFLYFGQFQTLPSGDYLFRTIVPAPYEFRGLRRAPHIHFAFEHPQHGRLVTELYFNRADDSARRQDDRIWHSRDPDTRDAMIGALRPASEWTLPHPIEANAVWCQYDVNLPGAR